MIGLLVISIDIAFNIELLHSLNDRKLFYDSLSNPIDINMEKLRLMSTEESLKDISKLIYLSHISMSILSISNHFSCITIALQHSLITGLIHTKKRACVPYVKSIYYNIIYKWKISKNYLKFKLKARTVCLMEANSFRSNNKVFKG